jgi:ABC-2 type transport system ATP-binding protein
MSPKIDSPIIDVTRLNKYFDDKHVVKDISLRVQPGDIFGFLGPNGSGKTTTIRILCGLLKATSGTGTCIGYPLNSPEIKKKVGYMTQHFSFYKELSVQENLLFVARLYQLDNKKECVKAILESFGLTERKDQLTGTLSGGWKQRVALAACLLHKPTLLLLDEPTAGVDPKARRVFWSHIHELSREGVTTLVSTHYMDEAAHCNRLAYLAQGELIVQGTTTDIISHAKLSAYEVKGEKLPLLLDCLEKIEGVEEITLLEDRLHITGKKSELTTQILKQVLDKKMVSIQSVPPLLEDAFISLVNQSELPYEG